MKPQGHIVASGIIGLIVWAYFRSFAAGAVSFISGIFLDADHFVDYYLNCGFTLKIKKIYETFADMDFKRLYLLLHSYELLLIVWALIYISSPSVLWIAMAIGMTQHIMLDQLSNPIRVAGYFLVYRIAKGFKKEKILR